MSETRKRQHFAALSANILSLSYGCVYGWISANYEELRSDNCALSTGAVTNSQIGWVASGSFLGSLCGALGFGLLADKIGRQRCLLVTSIPLLFHWIIIIIASNPMHLFVARFLAGVSGGACFTVIPLYITEFAEDNLRSTLGTYLSLSLGTGSFLIMCLGYFYNYRTSAWIMFSIPLIFFMCFILNPESPHYLALHNKTRKAEKSLRYYRGIAKRDESNDKFQLELGKLLKTGQTPEGTVDESAKKQLCWADFTTRKARKAFIISFGLIMSNQLSGVLAMINYMTAIFKEAGSNLSPIVSSIIVTGIQLLGACVATVFVERAGRKTLLLISILGIFLGQSTMVTYYYLTAKGFHTSSFDWLPIAAFSLIVLTASCGVLTVTFPVIAEITPPKIRSVMLRVHMSTMFITATTMVKLFPFLSESVGITGTIFIYAISSFLLTLFIAFVVPETKGKSIEAIQDSL